MHCNIHLYSQLDGELGQDGGEDCTRMLFSIVLQGHLAVLFNKPLSQRFVGAAKAGKNTSEELVLTVGAQHE